MVIIGEGSEKEKLKKKAKSNIEFRSGLSWAEVEANLVRARALLFPGEEDFGMIPLEVMAYGIPVLAYGKGGALETVVENKEAIEKSSGLFFSEQSIASLEKTITHFEEVEERFDDQWIMNHAKKFREKNFIDNFKSVVSEHLSKQQKHFN